MSQKDIQQLRSIQTFEDLVDYLRDEMDWPIEAENVDELTFEYDPAELGIDAQSAAKIESIRQVRPLIPGQPWGIFYVEFESKQLPITVMRRILNQLITKKRNQRAYQSTWDLDDLLFISAVGLSDAHQREMTFAHFHQESGDLPTLRVLGWDGDDTNLKMEHVAEELKGKLVWPKDTEDVDHWREQWAGAFHNKPRHVIRTATALAERMAELARGIRDAAQAVMAHETENGPLRKLHKAFQVSLIHDLTETDFADTYAQTITYGLLTAAISRTDLQAGAYGTALVVENVTDMVPNTNPFLKEMLQTFLHAGGREGGIDFDELGVQDVVDLLRGEETDLPAILRDFGNRTQGEDPVIHFYEHFLSAYNKQLKIQRGVFYTPQPVVSYIVRSVHELLQTEFGLADGLADTTTWGEMHSRLPDLEIPTGTDPASPFVMILDPATGTATFLVEVIDVIYSTLTAKWQAQGLSQQEQVDAWNVYVPNHLLPRLHGYELMMAPYAIAHMKIGLKLRETGYRFQSDERARIYLTNALEEPSTLGERSAANFFQALGHEAQAVNEVKRNTRFTVVIGNPPYSNFGMMNKGEWILTLIDDYKKGITEKKLNLDDDFIKFIRFGHWIIDKSGQGLLAFITNNTFIDGITHRRMRESLAEFFKKIFILDLHGSSTKREITNLSHIDENVFDIKQGVSINIFCSNQNINKSLVFHMDNYGSRIDKYKWLGINSTNNFKGNQEFNKLSLDFPNFFFVPKTFDIEKSEMDSLVDIQEIFIKSGLPIKTERDKLTIHFSKETLIGVVSDFITLSESELRVKYKLFKDSRDWKVQRAKEDVILNNKPNCYFRVLYRPFDFRYIWYSGKTRGFIGTPGYSTMQHMIKPNLAIITSKTIYGSDPWRDVLISNTLTEFGIMATRPGNSAPVFPLYLYEERNQNQLRIIPEMDRKSNISAKFSSLLSKKLDIKYVDDGKGDKVTTLGPEDILSYLYAMMHSNRFRQRYCEYLKIGYPKIPITSDIVLFSKLCGLGEHLITIHLFESQLPQNSTTQWNRSDKKMHVDPGHPKYYNQTVWINKTQGLVGVPEEVWEFHIGGYQVLHKWLKDRKGRQLSEEDITHYQKIIVAIRETIRIMAEIDDVIEAHGGWPIQ